MRILIYLLLGGVVLGALFYGARLVWDAVYPPVGGGLPADEENSAFSLLDAWSGRLFLFAVLLLFLLMAMDRFWMGHEVPADFVSPPAVDTQKAMPSHYY